MSTLIFPDIDLTGIQGVLIDIDNTLYPYEPAHAMALKMCYDTFVADFSSLISFETFNQKYREKRNQVTERLAPHGACRSRLFAFQALFEGMKLKQAFNNSLTYETLYWQNLIKNMSLDIGASHFLNRCKKRNLPVCVVSDMQAHFQIQKLQTLGIDHLIDYLVTSEEVGVEKPARKIFIEALNKLGLLPENVIMIGDNEEKDILGAQALGIRTFKVNHD